MSAIDLIPANHPAIHDRLLDGALVIACLCAAWCDVCTEFREAFDQLALDHPDKLILWIDIEDEAEVVGEFDVENFPTLLIEQNGVVLFFGAVEADARAISRLVGARSGMPPPASSTSSSAAQSNPDTLRFRLGAAVGRCRDR